MIYPSPFAPVTRWEEEKTIFDFIFYNNANIIGTNVCMIDAFTGATTTYDELISQSLRLGDGFTNKLKLQPGDTILIFSPNSTLYPALIFGAQASGVCVTTANSSYLPHELQHQITDSSASIILASTDLLETALAAMKLAGLPESSVYVLPGSDGITSARGLKTYDELIGNEGFKPIKLSRNQLKEAVAYLPFSSGTTGRGKGVEISHLNVIGIAQQLKNTNIFERDIVMGVLPLYHIYGLVVLLHQTFYNGGTIVLLKKFDLPIFCASVEKYGATTALIVPPIVLGLAKHPIVDNYDLSSLRFIISGAAPLSAELQKMFETRMRNASKRKYKDNVTQVLQGYGMTEYTAVVLLPDLSIAARPGSCGQLMPSMEARLVDENGKDVAAGESGELWVRGKNIMLRYHNNEKATKETVNQDGWLMTGDVCIRSVDGHFTIVDRTKELIKVKGFQAPPAVIEGILLQSEMVADAAVIGIWYESEATEYPRAYIVVEPKFANEPNLVEKITNFVAARVAPHLRIKGGIRFIDVIPKSAAGKILRKDLRVLAAQEAETGTKL